MGDRFAYPVAVSPVFHQESLRSLMFIKFISSIRTVYCNGLMSLDPNVMKEYLSLIEIILRWGFLIWELIFIYCGLFVLILVVFVLFLLSLRFGQISPLSILCSYVGVHEGTSLLSSFFFPLPALPWMRSSSFGAVSVMGGKWA